MSILDIMHDDSWREKHFTPLEKADQLLPATDPIKFANRYCELKYPIKQRGWFFLERNLIEVNASWVRKFYCNYFKTSLDAVNLRGKQILVTEEAIEDILQLQPKSDQLDGYQKAEEDMRFMKFDWDASPPSLRSLRRWQKKTEPASCPSGGGHLRLLVSAINSVGQLFSPSISGEFPSALFFQCRSHPFCIQDQASVVGVLLANADGIFYSIKTYDKARNVVALALSPVVKALINS
ncbi:hypothetical protein HN51_044428 [Arachis hypogaea]